MQSLPPHYRWLLGEQATPWLTRVERDTREAEPSLGMIQALRRDLGVERTNLVLDQVKLRRKAKEKFSRAEEMFFTAIGLEQSTDESLAQLKANRYPQQATISDICCGIGGDALGLSRRGTVHLIDQDIVSLSFAAENVRRCGGEAQTILTKAENMDITDLGAWHIDPDRRSQGKRTSHMEFSQPGPETLRLLMRAHGQGGIKLAPATDITLEWSQSSELEWLQSRGECRQQMMWLAGLARHPGQRTATLVTSSGESHSFTGNDMGPFPIAEKLGLYVYDPVACLLASQLCGAWCLERNWGALSYRSPYLTTDTLLHTPWMQTFQVLEVLPLDVPKLRKALHARNAGPLEIKIRGIKGITPESLRPSLRLTGEEPYTLMLAQLGKQNRAILCHRVLE